MLMKALGLLVAIALTLLASGCVSNPQPIEPAKAGIGTVPKTPFILTKLD
jgi:hypothetical protein